MVVMAIVFFVRIYTHYSGMWLYISAIGRGATVSNFDFKPYTVDLVYQADLLTTGQFTVMTRARGFFFIGAPTRIERYVDPWL